MWGYPDPRGPSQATNSNTAGWAAAGKYLQSQPVSVYSRMSPSGDSRAHISIIQEIKKHTHTHTHKNRQTVASALAETQHLGVRLAFQDIPVAMPSLCKCTGSSLINLWV